MCCSTYRPTSDWQLITLSRAAGVTVYLYPPSDWCGFYFQELVREPKFNLILSLHIGKPLHSRLKIEASSLPASRFHRGLFWSIFTFFQLPKQSLPQGRFEFLRCQEFGTQHHLMEGTHFSMRWRSTVNTRQEILLGSRLQQQLYG